MHNEKPGGHGERPGAVGLLDAALWDLAAKNAGSAAVGLSCTAATAAARPANRIAIYASGGHYRHADDIASLLCDDIRTAMARGHRRFKIKIGGAALGDDLRRIEAVLARFSSPA